MANKRNAPPSGFTQGLKKFFLSAFVVFSFIAYVLHQRRPAAAASNVIPPTGSTQATDTAVPAQGGQVPNPPTQAGTAYKDGTYTGPTVDVFYGLVQVQATIQNGKISNVQFLQYPSDRRTSVEINTQAMPWLTQEAIQTQSANVDLISGATLTSEGFANSLQAALQQAHK